MFPFKILTFMCYLVSIIVKRFILLYRMGVTQIVMGGLSLIFGTTLLVLYLVGSPVSSPNISCAGIYFGLFVSRNLSDPWLLGLSVLIFKHWQKS